MMAGLMRSEVSFRRQGSSGLVWDDKFLSGELNKVANQREDSHQVEEKNYAGITIKRSRSNSGGRGFHTGRVSPAIEPPSPKVSACGFCSAFSKQDKTRRRLPKSGKRKM
ncbi:uncharacterized protein At1g15400-like [Olea europaea var. sylvestris]|uniref:uncharacterized protein At1g15400-like n=1 Tax=Olea europaea var. sylvestris TaxID=158386 RepID=UPI000C1D5E1E|nr:uncharacterized protein At1g15400-like [Olea europaea var. sylvestris]